MRSASLAAAADKATTPALPVAKESQVHSSSSGGGPAPALWWGGQSGSLALRHPGVEPWSGAEVRSERREAEARRPRNGMGAFNAGGGG